MKVSSNTKVNTYGFLGQFPKMVEWVNKRQRKAMQAQGTSIENKLYESTVGIPRTDIEDDQVGLFRPMVQQAAQSAAELPDDLVFGLLKAGKTTLCYDGQNYFDTDHPVFDNVDGTGSSKEQSNLTTGTKDGVPTFYLFDTTNAIKPLIIVNAFKKSLIVAASFASLSLFNSATAELIYKPLEQPVEPAKPDLKIESVNEKFAEKYPNQYNSWRSTANGDGENIIYADEENPRLIVLWGGYAFAKEYNAPRGHFYAVTDVRNILRTGAPKTANDGPQAMACWTCKGPDVPRLIAEWGEKDYFNAKWAK
ncbi:cytochrome c-552, partial [Haemophilus influenzae HK1212]